MDPRATHKILYRVLTPLHPDLMDPFHHACKVDILLPGTIGIPRHIPLEVLHYESYFPDIPLIPFLVLLLLKVRSWAEHIIEERRHIKDRAKLDQNDIEELLDLGQNEKFGHGYYG